MIEIAITAPGGPEVLKPRHVAVPQPRAGELLVRVMAAGVNRPDVMQRRGEYPMPTGVTRTPGLEVAGQVVALGDGVAGFAIGDLICGLTNGGGYAEYCVLPAVQALPVPPGLDAVRAAAIPETFFTVWANVFGIGRVVKGELVLVHGGTNGIGSTALMLCKEFGVRACATDDGPQKCEAALALGAERAVDFRSQDFVDAVHEWTEGRGVDAVVDIVGGAYYERNITALAKDGRLVLIGFLGGEIAEKVNLLTIALKRLTISGSTMRARTTAEKAAIAAEMREKIWPAMAAGRCLPNVNAVFPLEKAADAHRFMESGGHVGKIVLQVGS
jgi:putative PIG3 family NAD(P)H quinone oxidoreductase